jgi:hypothetical protein
MKVASVLLFPIARDNNVYKRIARRSRRRERDLLREGAYVKWIYAPMEKMTRM